MSIRARVALAAMASAVLVVAVAAGVIVRVVEDAQRSALDERLRAQAQVLDGVLARVDDSRTLRELLAGVDVGPVARVVDRTGEERIRLGRGPDLGRPGGLGVATVDTTDGAWRTFTTPLPATLRDRLQRDVGAVLQVAAPLADVEAAVAQVRRRVWLVGLVAAGGTGLVASLLAGGALGSLLRLRDTAERVADSGDLTVRVPEERQPSELQDVARSINTMLARLEAAAGDREVALAASRAFAADAAHELRTPLTSMAANLEILRDNPGLSGEDREAIVADVTREQGRLLRTLESLQVLARADLAATPTERIDLADVVALAAAAARRRHDHLRLEVDLPDGQVEAIGWADGVRAMVDNLLDNAALHARRGGGDVHVRVAVARAGAWWTLAVDDDGPGIHARDRERILQRFERGTTAAPGTGLGLAIVAQQAQVHGAPLEVTETPQGGARFRVRLPAVPGTAAAPPR